MDRLRISYVWVWVAFFVLLSVPTLIIAAQTGWNNGDKGLIIRTALQANDTELYTFKETIDTEAELKALYNLEIGTDIQAYNANLDTFAGIAPSANIQSFLGATTYQAALNLLLSSDFTITGAVDLTGASSVSLGPIDAGSGILEIPNGTSGTTDTTGEIYLDTDGDTTNMTGPVLQMSTNGVTQGYLFPIAALPQAATEDNYIMKYDASAKTVQWEAESAGGDSVSIDGVGVTDPDFVSTGDIDFVDTSNTVTANLNDDVVAPAEMADADHGDVSWTSGVATVEAVSGANAVDSDAYVDSSVDPIHLANQTKTELLPIAWFSDGTGAPGALDDTTRSPWKYRDFAGATADEDVDGIWQIPDDCDVTGDIKFRVHYLVTNATGPSSEGVAFGLQGASIGDNDATNPTLGTAVVITDTGITATQWDLLITDWSSAVTFTNAAAGEFVELNFYRDQDNASDTYAQDVGVAFIEIQYVRNPK